MIIPLRAGLMLAASIGWAPATMAEPPAAPMHVATPDLAAWSTKVQDSISRQMAFPRRYGRADFGREFVEVGFTIGADGAPQRIEVTDSSRNPWTDRAAVAAIRRVKSLPPLPAALASGRRVGALLVFPRSSEPMAATKNRIEAVRQAAGTPPSKRMAGYADETAIMLVAALRADD